MKLMFLSALTAMGVATGVSAATIKAGGPALGTPVVLDPSEFVGAGACGSGESLIGDGCSVVLKTDPDALDAYGRFDPSGATWIDSQDLAHVTWTLTREEAFSSITIALTDAFDQPCRKRYATLRNPSGCSFFTLAADDASWSISDKRTSGEIDWLTIAYDKPVTTATLEFNTRLNDGWGIVAALIDATPVEPPASVPLPASGALLAFGLVGLAGASRLRR